MYKELTATSGGAEVEVDAGRTNGGILQVTLLSTLTLLAL